eukprot:193539-Chlamydomonas_euryale.AAC.2
MRHPPVRVLRNARPPSALALGVATHPLGSGVRIATPSSPASQAAHVASNSSRSRRTPSTAARDTSA